MQGAKDQETQPVRRARALLNVAVDADAPEVTRAYWRQARRLHPDLSADPHATEQFRALHAAYQIALRAALHTPPSAAPSLRPEHQSHPPAADPSPVTPGADTGGTWGWETTAAHDPDGDVWIVAGPVHVRASTSGARRTDPQEGQA